MCEACQNQSAIDVEAEIENFRNNIAALMDLHAVTPQLPARDQAFANDLYKQYVDTRGLSGRQWPWVHTLLSRVKGAEPILGSFKAIQVMFQFAGDAGDLKRPKIRLMSEDGTYVQLNFDKTKPDEIKVFRDGWAGNGYRKYCGVIKGDQIVPWSKERMTPDVVAVIQKLAADPVNTAVAMANLLGVCLYCGLRLSDPESKRRGYGETCAKNWNMPWGRNVIGRRAA